MMKELYDRIQIELDKHRVDEWHSVIPLSEDGASLVDDMTEVSYPGGHQQNGLFLHENEQSMINPKDAYTTVAYGMMLEDNDYIYNIFAVSGGCEHHEGHIAQITRHDKQKKEPTQGETFGVTESAIYYDENGM
jgi:hypothetical protein